MAEPAIPDEKEDTLLNHLLELRNRLLYSIVAVLIVFAPLAFFSEKLYKQLALPLLAALPEGGAMIATNPLSAFLTPLKLAFALALVISIPFLLYQLWAFVAPGLYRRERKLVLPLLVSSSLLFYAGMAFAYFVVFPLVFVFLAQVTPEGVQFMPDIKAYQDFVFTLFFAFGIAFELPVALVLLVRAGVVDPDTLAGKRAYVVVWTFVIAMMLTPPDILSQTLLAIPMLILFEIGLFVARRVKPRDTDEDVDNELRGMPDDEMNAELDAADRTFVGGNNPAGDKNT